jgi:hypothetical protein
MAEKTKPKLMPLHTSWMVSPSTPFLRLVALESASRELTHVEFVAYNQCEDTSSTVSGTGLRVVQPPITFQAAEAVERGPYRLLRIAFRGCVGARMYPAHSDSQVVDECVYDWTQVPGRWSPGEDIYAYLERDRVVWRQSGVCPDPRVYEVVNSPWLEEMQLEGDQRWKHYLILGHDAFVEVVAEGHEIIEGQVLGGW